MLDTNIQPQQLLVVECMIAQTKWSTPPLMNDAKAKGDTKPAANDTSGGSGEYYDGACATLKDAVKSGCRK